MRKKLKKSTWLTLALFLYVTAMAIYFLPRNTSIGDTEKYVSVTASYIIVALLWVVLRMKEKRTEQQHKDEQNNLNKKKEE